MKQTVRIIGGQYRGKKLHFPSIEGLRPTPDRVRETLFNWLMHDIKDTRCLDAFAGSGALGLEAFSRGAREVVMIEQSPQAYAHLKKIITQFKSTALKLEHGDSLNYLQKCTNPFDIIFLDPPFKQQLIPACVDYIRRNNLITPNGLLYLESDSAIQLDPLYWQEIKSKQNGQVVFGLFQAIPKIIGNARF